MRTLLLALSLCLWGKFSAAQSLQRIPLHAITPAEATGQDYTPWLNDDTTDLVQDVWEQNMKYSDVWITLQMPALLQEIRFFDAQGVFSEKPAFIYAVKNGVRHYLGKFEGLTYYNYVSLPVQYPLVADTLLIRKYSNNIPQKIQVYGDTGVASTPIQRLYFSGVTPAQFAGQDYTQWLKEDLDSTIGWGEAASFQYIDVGLGLQQKSLITKLRLWDTEGVFDYEPAHIYAVSKGQRTLITTFTGPTYMTFVDVNLAVPVAADSLIVHKFGRNIPQKILAYGLPMLPDPTDTIVPPDGRLLITAIQPAAYTGMDYSPWMSDDLDSLVVWTGQPENFQYVDIKLPFAGKAEVSKVTLYDHEGVFTTNPAYIYALNDTTHTLLGIFEGLTYKTFVDLVPTEPIMADALVVRKHGNHIPQKIWAYGKLIGAADTSGVENPPPPADTTAWVKIPIEPARWYQLNNSGGGLHPLTDGDTTHSFNTGYGRIFNNYDAYYPVKEGEQVSIHSLRFYDGEGSLGDFPLTLSVINDSGQRIEIGRFNGNRYNTWVGPYPDREGNEHNFKLDSAIGNVRFIVLNCWYQFPTEMELFGTYTAPPPATPYSKRPVKIKDMLGVNAFEWDFESPYLPEQINEGLMKAFAPFKGVRHYMDWEKLEAAEGKYTYNPVHSGGWNYDAIYERCQADGVEVLACLKTLPNWLLATYPEGERDSENVPVRYGKNFSDPLSYMEQAKLGFQYTARYGSNSLVPDSLLSVNTSPRWTNDPINQVRKGLGLIRYIECDNERDKWWKGRKAYQTAYEYAANLSAFYDGHKGTMGPGVGVKNADPNMKVVMAGLASPNTDYLRGMVEWCRLNRGYHADGSVNLCWDVINYHLYSNDSRASQGGYPTRGTAPEVSEADSVAAAFMQVAHEYCGDMPVWITELGYDDHPGSPIKAIPIGTKTAAVTKADWTLRSALLYARAGVEKTFFYQLYDDNSLSPGQFASSGLINKDTTRKPAADYLYQIGQLMGDYAYSATISTSPMVDKYVHDGQEAFIAWMPTEAGDSALATIGLPGTDTASVYYFVPGSDTMRMEKLRVTDGQLTMVATETPVIVKPYYHNLSDEQVQVSSWGTMAAKQLPPVAWQEPKATVYPNPTTGVLNISLVSNDNSGAIVRVVQVATGKVVALNKIAPGNAAQALNIAHLPDGYYVLELSQGKNLQVKKILKTSR